MQAPMRSLELLTIFLPVYVTQPKANTAVDFTEEFIESAKMAKARDSGRKLGGRGICFLKKMKKSSFETIVLTGPLSFCVIPFFPLSFPGL